MEQERDPGIARTPRRRATRKKAEPVDEAEPTQAPGDINYDELASAILRKLGRFLIALAEQD